MEQPEELPVNFKPLVSSTLKAMAWLDPKDEDALADLNVDSARLVIIFHSGAWWSYEDVPRHTARGLLDAPSAGRFFGANVKAKSEEHPANKMADVLVQHLKTKAL